MSVKKIIPGPAVWPIIGTNWTFYPIIGKGYDQDRLHEVFLSKFREYGPVIKEVHKKQAIVSIYNPEDIFKVLYSSQKDPTRLSHYALLHFRRSRPDLFASGGLVPRQPPLMASQLKKTFGTFEKISEEFVEYLGELSQKSIDGTVPNIVYSLHDWALENICSLVFDSRLDNFSTKRKKICYDMVEAGETLLSALKIVEVTTNWKYYETKAYRQMATTELYFYNFAKTYVEKTRKAIGDGLIKNPAEHSLIAYYLSSPNMDVRDIITTASDLLVAGHLTTAYATAFVLYTLGINETKQEILYNQLCKDIPDVNDPVKAEDMSSTKKYIYLRACYKEALRLNAVTLGTGRVLSTDMVLGNYLVEKGTVILTQNQVASTLDEYVDNAKEFKPERWLKSSYPNKMLPQSLPWLVLPFGFGTRVCLGKNISPLQTQILIAKIIRRYRVVSISPKKLRLKTILINVPDEPINIQFIPRENV
ncbi:hypothetical protein CHUAL_008451 [Chamberlinius hualienensis]